ncbi:NUDIX domain-containing protein [Sporosarcina sp. ACRSL]|uniref:NUDIX hydrolase n=1 Tax=Sporosarcina sp. ACRSL TaxID=2918215 RepID=UPI001EF6A0FA|nr:NUDIX domain-containing protein [Sporosarcina sp. ACRSL]MCG7346544.1 NUDIX domain-containing protein [Sporosarcina sp. ACRSL]
MVERLKVFDEHYRYVRDETRDTVHKKGLWHETFHCWLVDGTNVLIQKRSATKKDFPGLYDITAAGHLMANEEIMDGIREVEEELGIEVDPFKIKRMGVVRDTITLPGFIDNEFSNVFFYKSNFSLTDFSLQQEEVESIHAVSIEDLQSLFKREVEQIILSNSSEITLSDFVPHETEYFLAISEYLDLAKSGGM